MMDTVLALISVGVIAAIGFALWKRPRGLENPDNSRGSGHSNEFADADEPMLIKVKGLEREIELLLPLATEARPDDLPPVRVYVYRQFMKPAFNVLSDKFHNQPQARLAVQSDWVAYMNCLEEFKRVQFALRQPPTDAHKAERMVLVEKRLRAHMAHIEDAFAGQLGEEKREELQRIRRAPAEAFDRTGSRRLGDIEV